MKQFFFALGVTTLLLGLCSCDTYVGGYAGGPGSRPGYYRSGYPSYRAGYATRSYPHSHYRSSSYRRDYHHDRDHHSWNRSTSYNRPHHSYSRSTGARTNTRVNVGPVGVSNRSWLGL